MPSGHPGECRCWLLMRHGDLVDEGVPLHRQNDVGGLHRPLAGVVRPDWDARPAGYVRLPGE